MKNFNDVKTIKKIDPQNTVDSTEMLAHQMEGAWNQVKALQFNSDFKSIDNIVFCGMGASIYGALVMKAIFGENFPYPIEIISDYHLPKYVNNRSLVVLTSYSGTTEEVLSCADEAKEKNAKMLVLTKGGALAEFAQTNNIPSYIFDGKLNPAGVPRLGNGYTILGLMGLFYKAGIIELDEKVILQSIKFLKDKSASIKAKAMQDVNNFANSVPVVFAAEHLTGNAQILRNQFNETSKTFSAYYLVPDLNHHLMEGLQFPTPSNLKFIVLNSNNYSPKIKKRMELTIDVVKKNKLKVFEHKTTGNNIFEDFFEALSYGSFLTLYLGLSYDQNPAINPWVDYFKEELKKM